MDQKQNVLLIDTGNIIDYDFIQTQGLIDPIGEIYECIRKVCNDHIEPIKMTEKESIKIYQLESSKVPKQQADQQCKLKLSVKVFFFPNETKSSDLVAEVIKMVILTLKVVCIDQLTFSIQTEDSNQVVPDLRAYLVKSKLSRYINKRLVGSLGISDLDHEQLVDLLENEPKITPNLIQINLDACCDIPEDLSKLSKSKGIQLLTHNDPQNDFLPVDKLGNILEQYKQSGKNVELKDVLLKSKSITRRWVARYTFIQIGQGVLVSKGNLVALNI